MTKIKPYNDEIVEINSCLLCCKRFCSSKFVDKNLRSESAVISEKDLVDPKSKSTVRGRWGNRLEFLLSCIGFAVGLGNVWRFPIKVYYGGGGAFLIPYTILCLILGIPLLLMEMGLGQFSGRSPVRSFKLVPVLYGIGWCMMILNTLILIYYGVIIAWSYFYMLGSLRPVMAWTMCNNGFNSDKCLGSRETRTALNMSGKTVSSTSEFWDYYVTGFVKYPTREIYTMNEDPGVPRWHLTLCLLLVWIVAALGLMFGTRVSGKLIYFTALFPYVAIILLIILGARLPGAANGIKYYLRPNWKKMLNPAILRGAIEQLFFSCSIGMGGMITFASYNDFKDNIYRDAMIVIFADFLTSLLAGFAVFPILGYMAQRNGVPIEQVITSGAGLFFITYPEALATLPAANVWTFIFMLMVITLGMDSQFAMVETIVTGMLDVCPMIGKSKSTKAIFVWIVCFILFLLGIMLCTPGGQYYFDILDTRVSAYGLPIIVLLECIAVCLIYGFKQFRYDFRMMLGFSLNWYWFVMMAFVSPVIIAIILIASVVQYDRIKVSGEYIPMWGEVLAFLFLLLMLLPLLFCALHTIFTYMDKYPELKGKPFIRKLFEAPIYWGPLYFKNWLFGSFYREKIILHKNNRKFRKYAPDADRLKAISDFAMKNV